MSRRCAIYKKDITKLSHKLEWKCRNAKTSTNDQWKRKHRTVQLMNYFTTNKYNGIIIVIGYITSRGQFSGPSISKQSLTNRNIGKVWYSVDYIVASINMNAEKQKMNRFWYWPRHQTAHLRPLAKKDRIQVQAI